MKSEMKTRHMLCPEALPLAYSGHVTHPAAVIGQDSPEYMFPRCFAKHTAQLLVESCRQNFPDHLIGRRAISRWRMGFGGRWLAGCAACLPQAFPAKLMISRNRGGICPTKGKGTEKNLTKTGLKKYSLVRTKYYSYNCEEKAKHKRKSKYVIKKNENLGKFSNKNFHIR